jgi:zinc ribbon protein
MGTVFCDKCGASLEETARFCRVCGEATPVTQAGTEAITRRFDEPQQERAITSPVRPPTTTPQYSPHYDAPLIPQTSGPTEKSHKRLVIILAAMLAFMIIALGGLLVFLNTNSGPPPPPIVTGIPGDRPAGGGPAGIPPQPPPPTPPGIKIGEGKLDPSLRYPGAQVVKQVDAVGAGVYTLTSNDPVGKVTDWYTSKRNFTQRLVKEGKAVLISGSTVVTIKSEGNGSSILIVNGAGPIPSPE